MRDENTKPTRCPNCGYTKEDAGIHMDHHLCKNDGNAPWQREAVAPPQAAPTESPAQMLYALAKVVNPHGYLSATKEMELMALRLAEQVADLHESICQVVGLMNDQVLNAETLTAYTILRRVLDDYARGVS